MSWIEDARKRINISLITTAVLILAAFVVAIVALFCPTFIPVGETEATWFQRSGSIIVALAVWVELKNNSISGFIYPNGFVPNEFATLKEEYKWLYLLVRWLGFLLVISGTLIWGYGDILLKNLSQTV